MNMNAKTEDASSIPPQSSIKKPEAECIAAARELQTILEEEALILKRFGGAELLPLVSRKQFSICELARKLDSLRPSKNGPFPVSEPLRQTLQKIQSLNLSNRHFIQNSLSLWQDMLSILCPPGYGPADGPKSIQTPKGRAFSREI